MQYGEPIRIRTKPEIMKKEVEVEKHVPRWKKMIDLAIIPICLIGAAWTFYLYLG